MTRWVAAVLLRYFCASATPVGPHSSRPEIHRAVLRGSSRFGVETEKSLGASKSANPRRLTRNRASISIPAARLCASVVAGGSGECVSAAQRVWLDTGVAALSFVFVWAFLWFGVSGLLTNRAFGSSFAPRLGSSGVGRLRIDLEPSGRGQVLVSRLGDR